jgi:hypothetical protein
MLKIRYNTVLVKSYLSKMSALDSSPNSTIINSIRSPSNTVVSPSTVTGPSLIESPTSSNLYFITFLIVIIISWVLIDLLGKVIDNLAYKTFKFKPDSTWHSFIVATVCTLAFVVYILVIEPVGIDVKLQIVGTSTISTVFTVSPIANKTDS